MFFFQAEVYHIHALLYAFQVGAADSSATKQNSGTRSVVDSFRAQIRIVEFVTSLKLVFVEKLNLLLIFSTNAGVDMRIRRTSMTWE